MGKAGIHTRKWVSNLDKVMAVIPEEDRTTEVNIRDNTDTVSYTHLTLPTKRIV